MAKDKYHDLVKNALIALGWNITHDPYRIPKPSRPVEIDLGAEKLIGAEKGKKKIAVEIKSFLGKSEVYDFYSAIGQFDYYQAALDIHEPKRELFLAVPNYIYSGLMQEQISTIVLKRNKINLIVYDIKQEKNSKMGQVEQYRAIAANIIQQVYDRYDDADKIYQIISDEQNGHYFLYQNAWLEDSYRLYGTVIHIEVKKDGKVWLHYDGTELIIADWLLEHGVPNTDLVLGFHPPIVRKDTVFALE